VAGDLAEIYTVASPRRDLHFITPTPKDVLMVRQADVFVHEGLDAEPWRDPLLDAAGNRKFLGNAENSIDVSQGIALLEIPATLSRLEGDIHVFGNPHYWLDPRNVATMTRTLAANLSEIYPEQAAVFEKNASAYIESLEKRIAAWSSLMAPFAGAPVVAYHQSWPYLAAFAGLRIAGYLQPKPGIPPTSKHLGQLERLMIEEKIKVVIRESYNDKRAPEKVAKKTGATVIVLSQMPDSQGYLAMMESNFDLLANVLKGGKTA
jgi:ABC-type Zn uptake system ZnuABC Zn-binding protein ZnuA